jgi:hypothetical protein
MIGGTVETSASFEARYAPLSYPTREHRYQKLEQQNLTQRDLIPQFGSESAVSLLADQKPIERPIIPGRNSWEEMDARFSHCHSWAGSVISSCLLTIRWADHSGCHAGAQWDVSIAWWSIYS